MERDLKALNFTGEEMEFVRKISTHYFAAKEVLIFAEQTDIQDRTLPQIVYELRNCLDHFMRAIAVKIGDRKVEDEDDYTRSNLDKAYGHVCRAAYDALDWLSVIIKERISEELQDFSLQTINEVMPEYYKDIRPHIEQILTQEVPRFRVGKDAAAKGEENLVGYGRAVSELKDLFKTILNKKSSLVDHKLRLERDKRNQRIARITEDIIVGVVVGVVVGIAVWQLT